MRNRYIFVADILAVAVAASAAFVLRFDLRSFIQRPEFVVFLVAALLIKPALFYALRLYTRDWRYVSIPDLRVVIVAGLASSIAMAVFVGAAFLTQLPGGFSRAVLFIDGLLTMAALGGIRVSIRVLYESRSTARYGTKSGASEGGASDKRVLVVGAGDAGAIVVREMQRNPHLGMTPVGFLDDDPAKQGLRIYDVPVLGNTESIGQLVRTQPIDEVVIAMPTASGQAIRAVAERCQASGIRSRIIPGVFELLDGLVNVSRLRHVEISDLLRRRQVTGRADSSNFVTGRTVLVTGAGGSIGFELCRQVAHARPARLVMLGHGENSLFEAHARLSGAFPGVALRIVVADIRNRARIDQVFTHFRPDVVFHAAAHKHVHLMEENFVEAITNNITGTQNLVDAAYSANTERFVAISTDKAVSPRGIMGASKRMAGMIVSEVGRRTGRAFVVVRFGNVLGSRGSVVPFFERQIAGGGPVTITHPDMKRFFMTIAEAVHLVLEAGGMGKGGELFVLKMGEPVRIADLATDLIRLSGYTTQQIPIVITGARAGEKLEERLWEEDAVIEPTGHADILKVTEGDACEGATLRSALQAIERAAEAGDRLTAEAVLCEWIPTFAPASALVDVLPSRS